MEKFLDAGDIWVKQLIFSGNLKIDMNKSRVIILSAAICLLVILGAYAVSSMNLLDFNQSNDTDDTTPTPTVTPTPTSTATATDNGADSSIVEIQLNGNSITVNPAQAASVSGSKVTITNQGTYKITGSLSDGQVIVAAPEKEVTLILNGVDIHCSNSAPIYIEYAKDAFIVLADGTENLVSDGASYVFEVAGVDEPNAAVFSASDLKISGEGSLIVNGNYNDGIASKDELKIESGAITVTAVDDGIRGKDNIIVEDANININAGGDGLKSDNQEDTTKGYITIQKGTITITSTADAIQAETDITINNGKFTLTTGGGSSGVIGAAGTAKAIKANASVTINGGSFTINSADDAIHSNGNITINSGTLAISTGDDGAHADTALTVNGGDITISKSYEGIESAVIVINQGEIHIVSSDDGINVVGGNDASGMQPGGGGFPGDTFTASGDYYLHINGGYVYVNAAGDGIDINGVVEMSAGYLIINGPIDNANGALDFSSFKISGGTLVAVGSTGMAQTPGATSTQESVLLSFGSQVQAGTLINIQTASGEELLTFTASKQYASMSLSTPKLTAGTTYNVYSGGSSTGTVKDGLYAEGTYTPGTLLGSFTA